jgi:anaerobic dimethyl sulfoxide reductase subunit B (iron-sulfur subunit)
MRVYQWEKGIWPNAEIRALAVPCYHCENPVCIDACPEKALYKEPKYGAVLLDEDKCVGHRECWKACPYGAILFENDQPGTKASKCTMCIDRLEEGLKPLCVQVCDLRAFEFGPLEEIASKFGNVKQLEEMPDPLIAQPAAVFKPPLKREMVVPYDANKALQLWQGRGPNAGPDAPPVFESGSDVTNPPDGLVWKNKLVLKAKNVAELMYRTSHDE